MLCKVFVGSTPWECRNGGKLCYPDLYYFRQQDTEIVLEPGDCRTFSRISGRKGKMSHWDMLDDLFRFIPLPLMFHDHEIISWADAVATCCVCM